MLVNSAGHMKCNLCNKEKEMTEVTELQKVAALNAYRNSLIDQSEAVSDLRYCFLSVSSL